MPTYESNKPGYIFATHLRSMNYTLATSIADIIDNSIEADATEIHVDWRHEAPDEINPDDPKNVDFPSTYVCISDNGTSMTEGRLKEAFQYGATRENNDHRTALGAFGTGLKTASTAWCRRLTVTARQDPNRKYFYGRRLDLDEMHEQEDWITAKLKGEELSDLSKARLQDRPGVSVLWENLDLLLDYADPWSTGTKGRLQDRFADVEKYLSMVFHRFMSKTCVVNKNRKKVKIFVNDKELVPWNPIWTHLRNGDALDERLEVHQLAVNQSFLHVDGQDTQIPITIAGYVLPVTKQFERIYKGLNEFESLASPFKRHKASQGYYFYRADRIISYGGWGSGGTTMDEHTKWARVVVDFDSRADASFKVDISKGKAEIPNDLKDEAESIGSRVRTEAKRRERRHAGSGTGGGSTKGGSTKGGSTGGGSTGGGSTGGSSTGGSSTGGSGTGGSSTSIPMNKEDAIELLEIVAERMEILPELQRKLKAKNRAAAKFFNWN